MKNRRTFELLSALRKQIGDWAFARYLRNQGFSFETAYFVMFGRSPRHG